MEKLKNNIVLGDCLDVMRTMPDKCVDLVLTDPPYGGAVCRTGGRTQRYESGERLMSVVHTGGASAAKYAKKVAAWDESPAQEVFDELFRVSKHQIIWGGNYFNLPPTRCFNVWRKLTISENFTMGMCEYAWCSHNSNAKIWEFAPQDSERFHPTQKPLALILRQLEEYAPPGALVFDPFSGSGTTAIACHNLGLDFVCVEKDPDYHAASVARLRKCREQARLPLAFSAAPVQGELFS